MLILVAAVGSCDSDVPKEWLHTAFTCLLLGAEASLQTILSGYGCPHSVSSPQIPAGSQPFSSTPGCFPLFFFHASGVSLGNADAPTLPYALGDAPPQLLSEVFKACVGSWGTPCYIGHGGLVLTA